MTAPTGPVEAPGGWLTSIPTRWAQDEPSRTALRLGQTDVSYGELNRRTHHVAAALAGQGLRSGDRIAVLARNGVEMLELLFGAARAGVTLVPLNWRLVPRELEEILADSGSALVVADGANEGVARQIAGAAALPLLLTGPDGTYEAWRESASPLHPGAETDDTRPVLQVYTSGTTGRPKGVLLTHQALRALVVNVVDHWQVNAASVCAVAMPLFHIGAIDYALVGLHSGSRVVLSQDAAPDALLALMRRERITNLFCVPTVLLALAEQSLRTESRCPVLRCVLYGASPISRQALDTAREAFRCAFVQGYGLTETAGAVTELTPADHEAADDERLRSAGKPFSWAAVRIVDVDTGQECPHGTVGEVHIKSDQVMAGYWRRDDETAQALADGWLRTGDAGHLDTDGYLFVTDRLKDMIVTGGENVYPAEVERVLLDHPSVRDAAVVGLPDARYGERVHAVVVVDADRPVTADELVAFAAGRIAGYKRPRTLSFAEELLRNASGKILRRALRESPPSSLTS